ncbi:MAG: hypothetical protein JXN64_05865 [Spirochaetes bacterium]|nr:hypothetical protein [Spirochaetota bacterium]
MKKVEKTKQNIGVTSLDEHTRKKLFNEFVEAGGEVINEKEERKLSDFDRDLQKRFRNRLEAEKKQNKFQYTDINAQKKTSPKYPLETKEKIKPASQSFNINEISQFRLILQRFRIRLRLFLMNVADFTGYYFMPKFIKKYDEEYNPCLLSMQTIYFNIFKQNMRNGQRIIDSLDKIHPVYFELIELLSNVYDRTTSNEILEHFYNFPDVPQEIKELREPFTKIFRKLYPLNQHKDLILIALDRALKLQNRLEKEKFTFFTSNKRKVKNNIYIIFNKLYPRLYWLMCCYEKRIFISDKDIEDTISIFPEDMPGKRKKSPPKTFDLQFDDNLSFKDDGKEKAEDQNEVIPDPVQKGLELMSKIDIEKSGEIYTKNRIFKNVNTKDKIYIANLLFNEFDIEFSFILTTNKIKYNTIFKSSDNLDFKNKFANIYNEIGKCKNRLLDYANTLAAFDKLKSEKPISSTQFIEYSNRLSALNKEKNHIAAEARAQIKMFMEKLCRELKTLIDDMNSGKNIVVNPEDIISFETAIEGDKIINNKNVCEAIDCAYNYAMAFIYRLSLEGDLCGNPEFNEGEETIFDSNLLKEKQEIKERPPVEERMIKNNQKQKKDSILKELDDLL